MEEIICSACGAKNSKEARFCQKCGREFVNVCPECGRKNPISANFCSTCGYPLTKKEIHDIQDIGIYKRENKALKGSRRKVAVMFADVSGFTSICEKLDPEEVKELMNLLFNRFGDVIYRYEGYIDKYIGDCVMILFGAPMSHEDDALRAVLCAIDLMKEVKLFNETVVRARAHDIPGFHLSVGINFGDVVASEVGSRYKLQYTVIGDAVNIAQRLQSSASADEIYVSQSIYELTNKEINYLELGQIRLKGITHPVIHYKPLSVNSRYVFRRTNETPMINRKIELNKLLSCYGEISKGKGQLVLISGESGVGKSKLIYEFLKRISTKTVNPPDSPNPLTIFSRGIDYLRSADGWVLKGFLRQLFKIDEQDKKALISKKIDDFINNNHINLPLLADILKWILGGTTSKQTLINIERINKQDRDHILNNGISLILEILSRKFAVIIIFDDVQWFDETTKEFILKLAQNIDKLKVMLILIERLNTDINKSIHLPVQNYVKLSLKPLEKNHAKELIRTLIRVKNIDAKLEKMLYERSKGNPLYIEEHALMLLNEDLVKIESEKAFLKANPESIPVKIERLILARIDKLDDLEKHLIEIASVIGKEFTLKLLERLIEDGTEIKSILDTLEQKEIIENINEFAFSKNSSNEKYTFKHLLIQKAVYNTLLKQTRREYHKKIAESIEQIYSEKLEDYYELLTYHYSRADKKTKYLEYLLKLADIQESYGNFTRAENIYKEWIENYENIYNSEKGIRVLLKYVEVKTKLGKYKQGMVELNKIEEYSKNLLTDELYINFLLSKSNVLSAKGKYSEAFKNSMKALELAEKNSNKKLLADCYAEVGNHLLDNEYYSEALEYFDKAKIIRQELLGENHPDTAQIYNNIGLVYDNQRKYNRAIEYFEKALRIKFSVLGENHPAIATSYNNIGVVYKNKGEYVKGLEYYKKALKIYLSVFGSNHPYTAISYNNIGLICDNEKDYNKALEFYKKALRIKLSVLEENHPSIAITCNNIGRVLANQKDFDKAIKYYQKALKIRLSVLGKNHSSTARIYYNIGSVYLLKKEYELSIEYLDIANRIFKQTTGENSLYISNVYESLSSAYYELKNYKNAYSLLEQALKIKKEKLGEYHKEMGKTYLNLAKIHFQQNNDDLAQAHVQKAKFIAEKYDDKELLTEIEKTISYKNRAI